MKNIYSKSSTLQNPNIRIAGANQFNAQSWHSFLSNFIIFAMIICTSFITLASCSTTDNKATTQSNSNLARIGNSDKLFESNTVEIIFLPIALGDTDKLISKSIESGTKQKIISKIVELPAYFYNNPTPSINFVLPSKKLIKWAKNPELYSNLSELPLGESISIPRFSHKKNAPKYILLSQLKSASIGKNIDKIPYTNLTSIILDINIRITFYLISINQGVLVKEFTTSGHGSMSSLIMNSDSINNYSTHDITQDAFASIINSIVANLTNTKDN